MRRGAGSTAAHIHLGRTMVLTGGAVAALIVGSAYGNVRGHGAHEKVLAWAGGAVFLVLAGLATRVVTLDLGRVVATRAGISAGSAVRLLSSFVAYVVIVFIGLGMVGVPLGHLLVGGALTGVVLGIALQQALGNVFAGLVLLFARPFVVGDRIRVRSGSLGGILDGVVAAMGLTYVSLETQEGLLKIPNAAMLAAAVGPAPAATPDPTPTAAPAPAPAAPPAPAPVATPTSDVAGPPSGAPD
jgi:small-conductance mechanosensitive channel